MVKRVPIKPSDLKPGMLIEWSASSDGKYPMRFFVVREWDWELAPSGVTLDAAWVCINLQIDKTNQAVTDDNAEDKDEALKFSDVMNKAQQVLQLLNQDRFMRLLLFSADYLVELVPED